MLEHLPLPKSRLEALTDGIFAVAMTLLVFDLKIAERFPATSPHPILFDLWELLPYIGSYLVSFVVLCVFWLAHLRLLRRVREVDVGFVWLNLAFLLFTTLVPPLTSWIRNSAGQPGAAVVYGGNLLVLLLLEASMWRRALFQLADETVADGRALWHYVRSRYLFAAGIIVAGMVAALVEIQVGLTVGLASYCYLLLIGAGVVRPGKWGARVDIGRRSADSPPRPPPRPRPPDAGP